MVKSCHVLGQSGRPDHLYPDPARVNIGDNKGYVRNSFS